MLMAGIMPKIEGNAVVALSVALVALSLLVA
jgi:hypothetical protein